MNFIFLFTACHSKNLIISFLFIFSWTRRKIKQSEFSNNLFITFCFMQYLKVTQIWRKLITKLHKEFYLFKVSLFFVRSSQKYISATEIINENLARYISWARNFIFFSGTKQIIMFQEYARCILFCVLLLNTFSLIT